MSRGMVRYPAGNTGQAEAHGSGCQPCSLMEKNLDLPILNQVFSRCYLIEVNCNSSTMGLLKNHFEVKTVP